MATKVKAKGKTAPTYLELREQLSRRDRSLRDKVVSLEEGASFVRDGESVGIGGSTMSRTPMGIIWSLIRAGRKGGTCTRVIGPTHTHPPARRPGARFRALRAPRDHLVKPDNRIGSFKGDRPARRPRKGSVRRVKP